jgi:two-component system, chemotaxis family, response regulator Rcp1
MWKTVHRLGFIEFLWFTEVYERSCKWKMEEVHLRSFKLFFKKRSACTRCDFFCAAADFYLQFLSWHEVVCISDLPFVLIDQLNTLELDKNIKLTIIIVDDAQDDHFFIKESMRDFKNIKWISFYNGEEFLKYLQEKVRYDTKDLPDIVILDINMPKLSGFDVFELVKERRLQESIAFYILTTNLTQSDLEKCASFVLDCYKKPFSIDHFGTLMQKIILRSYLLNKKD